MIIQSKFHDYYDGIAAQNRDPKVVFKRESKIIRRQDLPDYLVGHWFKEIERISCGDTIATHKNAVLIFCGKPYWLYTDSYIYKWSRNLDFRYNSSWIYQKNKEEEYSRIYHSIIEQRKKNLFWNPKERKTLNTQKAFEDFGAILLLFSNGMVVNPCLKACHFPEHPYQVFQELMMSMSSQDPEIVEIEDKYKLTAHGFNGKSFKTRKGVRPNRKNKKKK